MEHRKMESRDASPYIPRRGKQRNPRGGESSQVVDPTLVLHFDEAYNPTEQHYQPKEEDLFYHPEEDEAEEANVTARFLLDLFYYLFVCVNCAHM